MVIFFADIGMTLRAHIATDVARERGGPSFGEGTRGGIGFGRFQRLIVIPNDPNSDRNKTQRAQKSQEKNRSASDGRPF